MDDKNKRLSRLIGILTLMQTKRLITATWLSEKFGVSMRTIYRDIKTLEEAGVPVLVEEGKGYTLQEGYKIPPIMFSECEASALITVEQIVKKEKDTSLIRSYTEAVNKIKAVLQYSTKDKLEFLSQRVTASPFIEDGAKSDSLIQIQRALTGFMVLNISYQAEQQKKSIERCIEPFALYYSQQGLWILIAYCRLRKDFRMFRLDRITCIADTDLHFQPHKMTLQEFLSDKEKNYQNP